MFKMEFRIAGISDADKVAELLVDNFNIGSTEEAREAFMREKSTDTFIIAEEGDKVVGFVSWVMAGLPKHQLVKIRRIAILGGPKMDDISEGLLEAAIQDVDKYYKKMGLKIRKIYAMVHASNKGLQDFYKKMGFIEEAKLKDHYYKGMGEVFLSMFFE